MWSLIAEPRDPYDADQLARALIPDSAETSAREWRAYARTFLAAVLRTHCVGAVPQHTLLTAPAPPRGSSPSPKGSTPSESARSPAGCAGAFSESASSPASGQSSPSGHGSTPNDPLTELWRRLAVAPAEELRTLVPCPTVPGTGERPHVWIHPLSHHRRPRRNRTRRPPIHWRPSLDPILDPRVGPFSSSL